MGLIWQEFKAIMADAWDMIAAWARWMLKGIAEMLRVIAVNYQLAIVLSIGIPFSLLLIGIPSFAALEAFISPIGKLFTPRADEQRIIRGDFLPLFLMFVVGWMCLMLTDELADRIQKRLEGKSKDKESEA